MVQKKVFTSAPILPTPRNIPRFPKSSNQNSSYTKPSLSHRVTPTSVGNSKTIYKKPKLLTPTEIEERMSKGLCFNCDEKYTFRHVCKNKRHLFYMEVEEQQDPVELEEEAIFDAAELLTIMAQGLETDEEGSILPLVSMHAISGIHDFRTMRVTVFVTGKDVQILIDTGSTHNFWISILPRSWGV